MSQITVVFFGCWGAPGHFLWLPNMNTLDQHECDRLLIPAAAKLDATTLFLPHPEKIGTGAITYLPAPNLTVLAWWGNNPWDERGKVNNAVITNGDTGETVIWQLFARYFSVLEKQLERPVILEPDHDGHDSP